MADLPAGPTWLFCPADRPDRFAKAAAVADVVVIDLEDGVTPARRTDARAALAGAADTVDPTRTVIRINPVGTEDHDRDLAMLAGLPFRMVMLAKTEAATQVRSLANLSVVALCETPRGVRSAEDVAAVENCVALMWGAEDLIAALGGLSSRHKTGAYRDIARHARNVVLLAAAANATPALDAVYLDIDDLDGLRLETLDAVASGFAAKVCIHPKQIPVVRQAFAPNPTQMAWAHRVLTAASAADARGAFMVDGQMIDEPLLRQARRILAG